MHYPRTFEKVLLNRLRESPRFIQAVMGPRQVGKTSGVLNVLHTNFDPSEFTYLSCDDGFYDSNWFLEQIQKAKEAQKKIIVLDEIQKIDHWSERLKFVWDQDKRKKQQIHCVILGSSSLQLSQGLEESLAGRFEVIPVHHWNFTESNEAFRISFNDYLLKGGYPGSYSLISDEQRFKKYMHDSIFEAVVTKDILRFATIKKPSLFRQTFILASQFPAQEVSYNKLLGQLHEAGNVDQIKHYLELFAGAFLMRQIHKWSASSRSRVSSPKLLPAAPVFTGLFTKNDSTPEYLGRVFESIVGSRLCEVFDPVYYWRDGDDEVDFVVELKGNVIGLEVKSKSKPSRGVAVFREKIKRSRTCIIDFDNYTAFEKNPLKFIEQFSA